MSDEQQSNSPTPSRARKQGQYMTPEERKRIQEAFLRSFRIQANITVACKTAGVDRNTIYDWKKRYKDFELQFGEAEEMANDEIDDEIYRRGKVGWFEPAISAGRLVRDELTGEPVMLPRYSDALLTMLAKARMPKYRDKQQIDINAQVTTMAESAKDELLADLEAAIANEAKEQISQE